jgi:hypothetical protein
MNKKFNKDHPNIYTFIEGIEKLQQKYDVKMLHLRVGARSRPPSLRYRKIDQKIASSDVIRISDRYFCRTS